MRLATLTRSLTPLGWLAFAFALVTIVFVVGRGAGLRWDPLNLSARRLEVAREQAANAHAEASARSLESNARAGQLAALEAHHARTRVVARATAATVEQVRKMEDADEELDPGRAGRLRAHDRELCDIVRDLDGCSPSTGPA